MSDLEDLERTLRDRLDAIGPAPRAVLLRVLKLPDADRAGRIGELHADSRTRTFAELLIDIEESPHARGVVLGELRERTLREGASRVRRRTRAAPRSPRLVQDVP